MKDNLKSENEKYEKLWDWVVWNQRFKSKIIEYFMPSKKKNCVCMYKMFKVTVETFAKNCVHTITLNKTDNKSVLWIKMIDKRS